MFVPRKKGCLHDKNRRTKDRHQLAAAHRHWHTTVYNNYQMWGNGVNKIISITPNTIIILWVPIYPSGAANQLPDSPKTWTWIVSKQGVFKMNLLRNEMKMIL